MNFIDKIWSTLKNFANGGFKDIYKVVYGSPQFPYWFTFQAIWSCYVVCRSTLHKKKTVLLWIIQLIITSLMIFAPREIFAFLFHKLSPIIHNPVILGIYIVVFLFMTLAPNNIFYKIVDICYYFIGIIQGANQARLFNLILRTVKGPSNIQNLSIAIGFIIMDQVIEIVTRKISKGEKTKMSNYLTVIRTGLLSILFWLTTHQNPLTKYIGIYQIYIPALIYAFVLGLFNASAVLDFGERERIPTPPPTPRPKRSATPTPYSERYPNERY